MSTFTIAQGYIAQYGWPISFTLGFIGCLLNICLFSRRYFRTTSCCLYFLAASIAMLIALCTGVIPLLQPLINSYSYNMIRSFCKTRIYFVQSSTMIYRWLMTMACIDRYLNTSNNISRQRMLNIHTTYRIIAVVVIIWLILPFHQVVWSDIRANVCVITNDTVDVYNSFFTIITGGLLPIFIMLVCTLLIQRNLKIKYHRLVFLRNTIELSQYQQEQNRLIRSRDRQLLLMLYVQILVYTISVLPWTTFMIYSAFTRRQAKSSFQTTAESFIRYLVQFLVYIYSVSSFYMYTLSSRTFRQELMAMFKSIFIGRHNRIQPSIN